MRVVEREDAQGPNWKSWMQATSTLATCVVFPLCLLVLAVGSGCSTIASLVENDPDEPYKSVYVYCGVKLDLRTLEYRHPWSPRELVWPFVLADLPFSAIADTLCLPYTVPAERGLSKRKHLLELNRVWPLTSPRKTPTSVLIWSKSSDEIIVAGHGGIKAIDVKTRAVRTIVGAGYVGDAHLSADGSKIFYHVVAVRPSGGYETHGSIYSISLDGGDRDTLRLPVDCTRTSPWALGKGRRFCLSPDGLRIAFNGLFVHNLAADSTERLADDGGTPIVFSPDGTKLLYLASEHRGLSPKMPTICRVEDRTTEPASLGIGHQWVRMARWDEDGMKVYYRPLLTQHCVRNVSTKEEIRWESKRASAGLCAWSPDGSKLAYWETHCLKKRGGLFSPCTSEVLRLTLFDLHSRQDKLIGYTHRGSRYPSGTIAISYDNSRIAFVLGSQVYVRDLPR